MDFKNKAPAQWESLYIEDLIDHLKPVGEVLEVGFSSGSAADCIQAENPSHHTIIEPDPNIAAKAREWAGNNPAITIIVDKWENGLPSLGCFDAIFFNDFNPELEAKKAQQLAAANLMMQKGQELALSIQSRFHGIANIKYSDADLDQLFSRVGEVPEMANFLCQLKQNGQISKEQYENRMLMCKSEASPLEKRSGKSTDPMLVFLKICLKNHMRKGSRFTCFSGSPISKFENPEFFEEIITNPSYDYEEKIIPVDVQGSCEYYNFKEALIMIVEKQV